MKEIDIDNIILIILGLFVSGVLFWGAISMIQKSFSSNKVEIESETPQTLITPIKAKNSRELEKEYMRKQRQKMRDYRR